MGMIAQVTLSVTLSLGPQTRTMPLSLSDTTIPGLWLPPLLIRSLNTSIFFIAEVPGGFQNPESYRNQTERKKIFKSRTWFLAFVDSHFQGPLQKEAGVFPTERVIR